MAAEKELFIRMVWLSWTSNIRSVDDFIARNGLELFDKPVAPGRNTVGWIIGHLAATNDDVTGLLGIDHKANAGMNRVFRGGQEPVAHNYPAGQIAEYWRASVENLNAALSKYGPDDWFSKHTKISAEDFAKEPHRNKLNVIISRANHIGYHMGQLVLAV